MRRLVTSDWQLDNNPRDRYRTDWVVNDLPKLIDKYKVDQLLFLGDLCESKDAHPAPLVNEIVNCFYQISQTCRITILQGNHDFLHNAHPFFEFVSNFPNVKWISKPTELDNCLYLPHTRDYKQDWKHIGFTKEYQYIFAHNIFDGVKANGQKLTGISTKIFPDTAQVISGDVHEPQELDDGKIIYVGSPLLCDFGDDYQPRVLLLDDLLIKSIRVQGVQKRLIDITWEGSPIDIDAWKRLYSANEGDIVKIRANLSMKDVADWSNIRQELELWATKNNWVINTIQPVVTYVQGERQKLVNSSKKSDEEYLTTFVSRSGADKKTAEVGKELMED